jgi:hypothetical protein
MCDDPRKERPREGLIFFFFKTDNREKAWSSYLIENGISLLNERTAINLCQPDCPLCGESRPGLLQRPVASECRIPRSFRIRIDQPGSQAHPHWLYCRRSRI